MTWRDALLCGGFSLALPIGQTLFKFAAVANARMSGPLLVRLITNGPLIGAFAWYGLTVFKEPLDWRFAVGYVLMLAGFAVIMQGQAGHTPG